MKSICLIGDIAIGQVAGAAARFVMDKVSTCDCSLEDPKVRESEEKHF